MNSQTQNTAETVVLVHGLWMHGLVMLWFASQLSRAGYQVKLFSYRSLLRTPAHNAALLARELEKIDTPVVHLVGHSLGGIVLMHLLDRQPQFRPGRMVLMGTPIRGCKVAANIFKFPLLRTLLLGRSVHQGLVGGCPKFPGNRELGVIAGRTPVGIGRLFMAGDLPNDGTVQVRETRISRARESLELQATHTSMIFSRKVAEQVSCFLANGRFSP